MKKIILLLCCFTLISACSDNKRYAPKEGRLSVFDAAPIQQATGWAVLNKATPVESWQQPYQNQQNKVPHIAVTDPQKELWSAYVSKNQKLQDRDLPTPVLLSDAIYVLDSAYTLSPNHMDKAHCD